MCDGLEVSVADGDAAAPRPRSSRLVLLLRPNQAPLQKKRPGTLADARPCSLQQSAADRHGPVMSNPLSADVYLKRYVPVAGAVRLRFSPPGQDIVNGVPIATSCPAVG